MSALRYVYGATPSATITLCSDHDFKDLTIIRFYQRFLPGDKRLVYIPYKDLPAEGTQWYITQTCADYPGYSPGKSNADPFIFIGDGLRYRLQRRYPCFEGVDWSVYRRESDVIPQP